MAIRIMPIAIIVSGLFLVGCGSGSGDQNGTKEPGNTPASMVPDASATDESKGIGKFKDVPLAPTLDAAMADNGQKVYDLKCGSCHKLTNEKLVGPGWQGVTSRHKPEWIMNFTTNVDEMLNKDPKAMVMLEECLVRMPNQNLNDDEARQVLEFMRKNDGVK